jgi:hypothetical protein
MWVLGRVMAVIFLWAPGKPLANTLAQAVLVYSSEAMFHMICFSTPYPGRYSVFQHLTGPIGRTVTHYYQTN